MQFIRIMLKNCDKKAQLMFTDADSLMCEIKTENVAEDFYKDEKLFDFANYLEESEFYDDTKNYVVGSMFYETCGVPMKRFVELKPKVYS